MQWLNQSLYQKSETVSFAILSDSTTNRSIKEENPTYLCKHIALTARLLNSVRPDLCATVLLSVAWCVAVVSEQLTEPIFRAILTLKMGPVRCSETLQHTKLRWAKPRRPSQPVAYRGRGGLGRSNPPPPEIPKALQNRAKPNPVCKNR